MTKGLNTLLLLTLVSPLAFAGGSHGDGHAMPENESAGASGTMQGDKQAIATGQPGDPAEVSRTIEVTMDDSMHFVPDDITVRAGQTVRFFAKNRGKMPHEMVIGPMEELMAHAEMMRKMPDMAHAEPNMVTLEPGQQGGLVWKFDQPGTVDFACLIPGHMEAGMIAQVTVIE
jgi:uncharacterized cupredoxin-like copper-binding protein